MDKRGNLLKLIPLIATLILSGCYLNLTVRSTLSSVSDQTQFPLFSSANSISVNMGNSAAVRLEGTCPASGEFYIYVEQQPLQAFTCDQQFWTLDADFSAFSDGLINVYIGNASEISTASERVLVKDTSIELLNSSDIDNADFSQSFVPINIDIGEIGEYSYKLGSQSTIDCSSSTGYSEFFSTTIPLDIIQTLSDQYRLCLVVRDTMTNTLPQAQAFQKDWSYSAPTATYADYRGVQHIQAFGNAPNAPSGTPSIPTVRLVWLAFNNETITTNYKVLRVATKDPFDYISLPICSPSQITTCLVCSVNAGDPLNCQDTQLAGPPAVYDYIIALGDSANSAIPIGANEVSHRITVPIPPDNMILVQRDAVNFEMCNLLNSSIDPLNHNRCLYDGPGGIPFSSGHNQFPLNLDSGYYDFGYNLFIDRWEAGCNWTRLVEGGKCGAGGTDGDCFGAVSPSATIGIAGQVYYNSNSANCYFKTQGNTWELAQSSSLSVKDRPKVYVNSSTTGKSVPPLAWMSQKWAAEICAGQNVSGYGKKRLMRLREFIAASSPARILGDLSYLTETQINDLALGTNFTATNACNTNKADGITPNGFNSGDELARNPNPTGFDWEIGWHVQIGSQSTKNCVTRYGAQDFIGNTYEIMSDQISHCGENCRFQVSKYDNGNRDFLSNSLDSLTGFILDGINLPASNINTISLNTFDGSAQNNYVYFPLGLPSITNTFGVDAFSITDPRLTKIAKKFEPWPVSGSSIRGVASGGSSTWGGWSGFTRLDLNFGSSETGSSTDASWGMRCALPAESADAIAPYPIVPHAEYLWVAGSSLKNAAGIFGTLQQSDATSRPGGRINAGYWSDSAGNLWLFGGQGVDVNGTGGTLNDLWRFNIFTGEWTWMGGSKIANSAGVWGTKGTGSTLNYPSSRKNFSFTEDLNGNLWLHGGIGIDSNGQSGILDDLWKFDPLTSKWTWIAGSSLRNITPTYGTINVADGVNGPGGRNDHGMWVDKSGLIYLFGGMLAGSTNPFYAWGGDFWRYNTSTAQWTYLGGPPVNSSLAIKKGDHGTKGLEATTNKPPARHLFAYWSPDDHKTLWLFGGEGTDANQSEWVLNDLWKFDTLTGKWTWMNGSKFQSQTSVYGASGTAGSTYTPSARVNASYDIDQNGNFWLINGFGKNNSAGDASLDDFWSYNPSTNEWTYWKGSSAGSTLSVWGTKGVTNSSNYFGAGDSGILWVDQSNNLWLFGGGRVDSGGSWGLMSDLWFYEFN